MTYLYVFLILIYISTSVLAGDSFYAISSLRYLLDQDGSDITYTSSDVEDLFFIALKSGMEEIEYAYREHSIQNVGDALFWLERAWIRLSLDREAKKFQSYPYFDQNPLITKEMRRKIAPYLLPLKSPLKKVLDKIFSQGRVTYDEESFTKGGFQTLVLTHASFIHVALHPLAKGYLFKIALDSETRLKDGRPAWEWLVDRCVGAKNIRNLINKMRLKHFLVPDKWLFPLFYPERAGTIQQPVALVETYFDIGSFEESRAAWLTKVDHEVIEELYLIISHGYSSASLAANIPYVKSGKFACIDTEYTKRKIKYSDVRQWLSDEMREYWDLLVRKGGKVTLEKVSKG